VVGPIQLDAFHKKAFGRRRCSSWYGTESERVNFFPILTFCSKDIHHYWPNKNFGFVLILWDHLFGTYSPVVIPPKKPSYYKQWWEWSRNDKSDEAATEKAGF